MGLDELHSPAANQLCIPACHIWWPCAFRRVLRADDLQRRARQRSPSALCRGGPWRINFSIFGTTSEELAAVQHDRYRNIERAARKLKALTDAINAALAADIGVNANIVVPDQSHIDRVHRLLDEYSPRLSVRLLNSLDCGETSIRAIETALDQRGAVPEARYLTAGVSGARTAYRLPGGRRVFFKQIRRVRLPTTCAGCLFNNDTDCQEGFYGVRLYRDRSGLYQFGFCIQRMDLCRPLDEFLRSDLPEEILALRAREVAELEAAGR
ncbi:hypothetical protein AB0K15_32515 [Amycolatopsis sp. NPDC049253]|uniref:hypothetical protein n=1 Tax=Amycolatopsis sp. NPDC049253 TaxID=3155274 RepID=UPI0034161769